MEYHIITKTEVINSNMVNSNIGYVTDKANADTTLSFKDLF